jgi:hypothetical protein
LQECGLAALSGFAKGESHDSVAAGGSNGLRLALKAVKVELGSGAEGISESPHAFCILMNFIHQITCTRNVDLTKKIVAICFNRSKFVQNSKNWDLFLVDYICA